MILKKNLIYLACILLLHISFDAYGMVPYASSAPANQETNNKLLLFLFSHTKTFKEFFQEITMREKEEELKESLKKTLDMLKVKDNQGKIITEQETQKLISLWDKLKSLYDYHWMDKIVYPFRHFVSFKQSSEYLADPNNSQLKKFVNKKLSRSMHPDKYSLPENQEQMNLVMKEFNDLSKPSLPLDGLAIGFIDVSVDLLTMFSFRLINKISPDVFKQRKDIIELKELKGRIALKKEEVQIKKSILALKREEMKIMNIISKMN